MKPPQPGGHKARKNQSPEHKLLNPPWRAVGAGIASLGTPVGIGVVHPVLGELAAAIEVVVALTIFGTALFGSQALSERAFRLLRWIGNQPEPPGPPPGHPGDGGLCALAPADFGGGPISEPDRTLRRFG